MEVLSHEIARQIEKIKKGEDRGLFSKTGVDDAVAIEIAEAMKGNKKLDELNLSDNQFGDAGLIALAESLKGNNSLTRLDIGNNKIGDAGVIALAESLKSNRRLVTLYLFNLKMSDAGLIALAECFKRNPVLEELGLGGNSFTEAGITSFCQIMEGNNNLKSLDIQYGAGGITEALVPAFKKLLYNSVITDISYIDSDCPLSQKSQNELREVLRILPDQRWDAFTQLSKAVEEVHVAASSTKEPAAGNEQRVDASASAVPKAETVATSKKAGSHKFDFFISHNWGEQTASGSFHNHDRVAKLNQELIKLGATTWFDSERMKGNIKDQMCQGIENSKAVIICITETYIEKVGQLENAEDNCKLEFGYASRRKTATHMLPVVMESSCLSTKAWTGQVGMVLGGELYENLTDDSKAATVAKNLMAKFADLE